MKRAPRNLDEIDTDDELVEGIRLGGRAKLPMIKRARSLAETKQPYCRPDRDCSPDEDADGANVCEDCDDNDPNNFPGNNERCDEQDNDCDDKTDEGFILGAACDSGEGECIVGGLTICAENGMQVTCDAEPNLDNVSDETCDDKDNDCDGKVDEEYDVGDPCVVGVGVPMLRAQNNVPKMQWALNASAMNYRPSHPRCVTV